MKPYEYELLCGALMIWKVFWLNGLVSKWALARQDRSQLPGIDYEPEE